jgi:hypothetical protein
MYSAYTTADATLAMSLQGFSATSNMEVVCVVIVHVSLLYYEQSVVKLLVFCFRGGLCCFIFISASILALLPFPGKVSPLQSQNVAVFLQEIPLRRVLNSFVCK